MAHFFPNKRPWGHTEHPCLRLPLRLLRRNGLGGDDAAHGVAEPVHGDASIFVELCEPVDDIVDLLPRLAESAGGIS